MTTPKVPGVYVLADVVAKKCYVGSSVDLKQRLRAHERLLKADKHHNTHLQNAFNRNKELIVIPIPVNDDVDTLVVEQQLIDELAPTGALFNFAMDVSAPTRGLKQSPESIEKRRQSNAGFKHAPETLVLLSELAKERGMPRSVIEAGAAARVGKKLSPEHIEKVRQTSIERMQDPAARENLSKKNLGIKHTPEAIALMKQKCAAREANHEYVQRRNEALMRRHQREREAKLALSA